VRETTIALELGITESVSNLMIVWCLSSGYCIGKRFTDTFPNGHLEKLSYYRSQNLPKKPGFCDNFCGLPKIKLRNPVSVVGINTPEHLKEAKKNCK
jgi:hypothetical protein